MSETPTIEAKRSTLPGEVPPTLPSVVRDASLTTTQSPKRRSPSLALLLLVGALGIAFIGWYSLRSPRGLPEGLIQANGRIESDVVNVSSKLAGRIVTLGAREGDVVKAGALLVQLDDRGVRAQLQEAQSALATARARAAAARVALSVMRKEVPVSIATATANMQAAEAAEHRAITAEAQSKRDADRARRLLTDGSVPQQMAEQAELAWISSLDQRAVAQATRAQSQQALADAQLGPDRIRAKEAELVSLDTQTREAMARVAQAQTAVDDLRVVSPIDAVITSRFANLGEVVNAGMPLLELVDLDRLYLKVYVPEREIGKVRLGLHARIYSDAFPQAPLDATVRYIASRAEFTPKEVQTPDERTKLVYEVRLYLDRNPNHQLTPGLPADAIIRWKENVPWTPPRW
ncbi:MAG TPA: HlyD family efflux transporter periplasmic adaptor subunit [Steroidobacteraceae bacterium]|nr:HlyD family efflux transporter periplasmic adaptor subunit [Steroidobacteraceae bacterium]